jgi:bacteriocin-like protein
MKTLSIEKMENVEGGAPTCANSFFMSLTGIGVVVDLFNGGDGSAYHEKFLTCVGIM